MKKGNSKCPFDCRELPSCDSCVGHDHQMNKENKKGESWRRGYQQGMKDLIDKAIIWAGKQGIVIPDPDKIELN